MAVMSRVIGVFMWVGVVLLLSCARANVTPTPTPIPTRTSVPATPTFTPAALVSSPTPRPSPVLPTATPTQVSIATATARRGPTGSLNVVAANLGNEDWVPRMFSREYAFVEPMTDTLVKTDLVTLLAVPGLAESWDIQTQPNGEIHWTFKLRKGVQFHKGQGEVTAEDVRETLLSFGKPGTLSGNAFFIWNDWLDKDPSRIQATDPYTLFVRSPRPISVLLDQVLSDFTPITYVYPKKYMDQVGEDGFRKSPVFSGPFEFREHRRGERFSLKAVTQHWRVVPEFAEINFIVAPETATAIAMLKTGFADIAPIPATAKGELQSPGLRIVRSVSASEDFIVLGGMYYTVARPGFGQGDPWVGSFDIKDPMGGEKALKVRQALNLAVDRQAILDKILLGEGYVSTLTFSFLKEGAPWWNSTWKPYPYDPKRAKELLGEAGYPNGFEVNLWLVRFPEALRGLDEGEAVASLWEQNLGIKVNRIPIEYRPTVRSKLVDRSTKGFAWTFNNVNVSDPTRYGCAVGGPSTSGVVHSEHPMWDQTCNKTLKEMDRSKQATFNRELGDFLYRNYPNIPIAYANVLFGVGSKVGDWQPRPRLAYPSQLEYIARSKN